MQNDNLRFRWSSLLWPGEDQVARGGVEPPTFRFSGGRSYQLSYLTMTAAAPGRDAGRTCCRAERS